MSALGSRAQLLQLIQQLTFFYFFYIGSFFLLAQLNGVRGHSRKGHHLYFQIIYPFFGYTQGEQFGSIAPGHGNFFDAYFNKSAIAEFVIALRFNIGWHV